MKVKQYFPVWQISVGDKVYKPAAQGETPVAITDLQEDEIRRLLEMGAIRTMVYDDGAQQQDETPEPPAQDPASADPRQRETAAKEKQTAAKGKV